jgi:hypothetical protein
MENVDKKEETNVLITKVSKKDIKQEKKNELVDKVMSIILKIK